MQKTQTPFWLRYAASLFLSVFIVTVHAQVQTPKYVSMTPDSKGYYEYLPQGYSSGSKTYPLIVFIHGSGELGDGSAAQLPRVLTNATPMQINQGIFPATFTVGGQTFSFIVISPQFIDWPTPLDINNVIDYAVQHYRIDPTRIYLTGLSMGGGKTWDYAGDNSTYANRLAAILPVSGASYPDVTRSQTIAAANIAVWATHNDQDPTVPSFYTVDYVNYINAAPVPPTPLAKKTIFSSTSHDAWTKTYDLNYKENGVNVYEWMLQYKRGSVANRAPVANAGLDASITLPTKTVSITGSGTDADGTIASYQWTQVSGPSTATIGTPKQAKATFKNLVAGTYVFQLKVTDNLGATGTDQVQVFVNPAGGQTGSAKYVNVNVYGGTNPFNNTAWNNWNVGTSTATNITSAAFKFSDGTASAIKGVLSYTQAIGDNDASYPGGMAPAEVLRYTSYSLQERTLTITGLSASTKYNFEFYASRYSADNSTIFTINGSSITIVTYRNFTNKAVFNSITPNAQGQIIIDIKSATNYNYLNGFMITQQAGGASRGAITEINTGDKIADDQSASAEVFPNPATDKITLQVHNNLTGTMNAKIITLNGVVKKELLLKHETPFSQVDIPVKDLPAGIYFLKLQIGKWSVSKKIIKS